MARKQSFMVTVLVSDSEGHPLAFTARVDTSARVWKPTRSAIKLFKKNPAFRRQMRQIGANWRTVPIILDRIARADNIVGAAE